MIIIIPCDVGITNPELLLLCFKNIDKSEVVVIGVNQREHRKVENMLNCRIAKFPIKYYGPPISDRPLRVVDWKFFWAENVQ
jgi:hypothetical protein